MISYLCLSIMMALWVFQPTAAAATRDCKSGFGERLDEVISAAEYIALYSADDFHSPDTQSRNGTVILSLVWTIRGEAPLQVRTPGVATEIIPPDYFDLIYSHQQIVDLGYVNHGLSVIVPSEGCVAIPAEGFVPGYTYLVLGGVESRISFEPILSEQDPLLRHLVSLSDSQ